MNNNRKSSSFIRIFVILSIIVFVLITLNTPSPKYLYTLKSYGSFIAYILIYFPKLLIQGIPLVLIATVIPLFTSFVLLKRKKYSFLIKAIFPCLIILSVLFFIFFNLMFFAPLISLIIFFLLIYIEFVMLLFSIKELKKENKDSLSKANCEKNTIILTNHHNKQLFLTLASIFIFIFGISLLGLTFLQSFSSKTKPIYNTKRTKSVVPSIKQPINKQLNTINQISKPSLKGKLIYMFEGDLWASDVNGGQKTKLIEGESFNNDIYIKGWSNEKKLLYFIVKKADHYDLYGKNLSSEEATLLSTFPKISGLDLSISPDGKYLLYPDKEGNLFLYDLENKTNKKILTHRECIVDQNIDMFREEDYVNGLPNCYDYNHAIWSKSGTKAIIKKNGYTYSTNVLINPFNPILDIKELWGGSILYWSNDDKKAIIGGTSYNDGAGKIYFFPNINNPSIKIELLSQPQYIFINNWLVSDDGNMILATYQKQDSAGFPTDKSGAVLYSVQNDSIESVLDFDLTDFILHFWLSDNRTILMENYKTNTIWTYDTLNSFKQKLPIKTDGNREIWLIESL